MAAFAVLAISCNKNNESNPAFTGYSGYLYSTILYTSGAPYADELVAAYFPDTPATTSVGLNVGTVYLNGIQLVIDDPAVGQYSIEDATFHLRDSTIWRVSGGSGISAFTFNHLATYPSLTATLPDTVSKSGFSIPFTVNTVDSVSFSLRYPSVSHTLVGSSSIVNFSAGDLAIIPDNTLVLLEISSYVSHAETINGKEFAFIKEERRQHYVWVQP